MFSYRTAYPTFEESYLYVPKGKAPYKYALIGVTRPTPHYDIRRERPKDASAEKLNVIEYVLSGEGEILVDGKWIPAHAGDLFIIRSIQDQFYRANKKNPWKKIWFNYYADYLDPFLDAYGVKTGVYSNTNVLKYFEIALEIAKSQSNYADASYTVSDCIHKIIQAIASTSAREQDSVEFSIREELDNAIYKKADLEEIAQRLHLSKSNLIRVFKKGYGITPYEYLINSKLEMAKMLLLNTTLSSKEIASRLCFSNEHYFSTLFLQRVGLRPRAYRMQKKENHDQ